MRPSQRDQLRLQALADAMEPKMRAAFAQFLDSLRPDQLPELIALLESGDVAAAVDFLFSTTKATAAATGVRASFAEVLLSLVRSRTKDLSVALRITVRAATFSPSLILAVRRWEDTAFRRVLADTREGLVESITDSLAKGIGPRQVATTLKADISAAGLTKYDNRILRSYRQTLEAGLSTKGRELRDKRFDKMLDRLRREKGALTTEQVDTMVAAYRRKLVAFRAQTFARTASIQAANEATSAGWRAAVEQGVMPAQEVKRYWIVAQDERLCKICEPIPRMNENGVGLDEPFHTPQGPRDGPTMHPNCRCTTWIRRERAGVVRAAQPGTTRLILPR